MLRSSCRRLLAAPGRTFESTARREIAQEQLSFSLFLSLAIPLMPCNVLNVRYSAFHRDAISARTGGSNGYSSISLDTIEDRLMESGMNRSIFSTNYTRLSPDIILNPALIRGRVVVSSKSLAGR